MSDVRRMSRSLVGLAVGAAVVTICVPAAAAGGGHGAPGGGDPYFPRQGNGGYDVASYQLHVNYDPATHRLRGQELVRATATQSLTRFDLDLRTNMRVSSVAVDGEGATAAQPASEVQELVITPQTALAAGQHFTVALSYAGKVKPVIDPDGSLDGYIPTDDGAFVASEPQGSPSWFAVDDSPADKASYDISTTVPDGLSVIGNGRLVSKIDGAGKSTWRWRIDQPISSYLVTSTVGRFDVSFHTTPSGLPYVIAVDPREAAASASVVKKLPAIIRFFESKYGPYPFDSSGAIIDDAPQVGYALETATRPVFDGAPSELTFAHELAHQWFGDDVTVAKWQSIWLNEGFAEFSDWLWGEHQGGTTGAERLQQVLAAPVDSGIWNPPPANPGSGGQIFDASVYIRGAAALEALREKLGDPLFFRILRGWAQTNSYSNATVPQFIGFASAIANRDLSGFFHKWLYEKGKPFGDAATTAWAPTLPFVRH